MPMTSHLRSQPTFPVSRPCRVPDLPPVARIGYANPPRSWHLPETSRGSGGKRGGQNMPTSHASPGVSPPKKTKQHRTSRTIITPGNSQASSPFSTCQLGRSTEPRALPARYGPPSGFGYPLGGLIPPEPGRPCFMPTALMGFTLRSVPLAPGAVGVTTNANPHAVSSGDQHGTGEPATASPRRTAAPGLWPRRESLATAPGCSRAVRWMLPWVSSLLGCTTGRLTGLFAQAPPTRFVAMIETKPPASRSIYRHPADPARPVRGHDELK